MKLSKADFLLLRWSLAAICGAVLGSMLIFYGSIAYAQSSKNEHLKAQRMLNDAHGSLALARQDKENMGKYANEYAVLLKQRIIGDDQRLDWVEGLEHIRRHSPVLSFSYQIAPQRIYLSPTPMDSGNFNIHYSEMKLQFELLHERQLFNFFAALQAHIKGHYHLESCSLQRSGETRLKAECNGNWITLKKRS